jgi:hypothetical protein
MHPKQEAGKTGRTRSSFTSLVPLGDGGTLVGLRHWTVWQQWQTHEERRACSFTGLEPDLSAVLDDQLATQIETHASSADALRLATGCPDKAAKEASLVGLRNADALIAHADQHRSLLLFLTHGHLDRSALRAVLNRIAEQVGKHLLDAVPVRIDHDLGEGGGVQVERELMVISAALEVYDHSLGEAQEIERLLLQSQPPGLQAHRIEQISGEPRQAISPQLDLGDRLGLPLGHRWTVATRSLGVQHTRKALDR